MCIERWSRQLLLPVLVCAAVGAFGYENTASSPSARPQDVTAGLPLKLSVDDAVRIGLSKNPQIAAGAASVAAAQATYRSFAAFPSVQLGVTHSQGTSSSPTLNGQTTDTFVDVGETVDVSGQRRLGAAAANSQYRAARFQFEETRLSLEQQIRDAYWALVTARAQTAIAQESLRVVEQVHGLTEAQEKAGSSPQVDVIRSGIDVANARQAFISAQGAENTALAALNTLLARAPLAPTDTVDGLTQATAPPDMLPNLPDLPGLQKLATANRPLLGAAKEQVRAADYALKQARASRFPDLGVDYERSVQNSPSADAVVMSVRFPLLDLGAVRHSIRAASDAKNQAEAQATLTELQVAQQVAQAYVDFTQAVKLAASYRTDIIEPSQKVLEMAQIGYKQGATGILPVIDAENTLRAARTGYVSALMALYKARDEVIAATGGLTEPRASGAKGSG